MINRRHIRVKVMQSVYAMMRSGSDNLVKEKEFLNSNIVKLYELYILNLQLLVEVQKHAKKFQEKSKKKYLATSEDLNPNKKFINNQILTMLKNSVTLKKHVEDYKLNNWNLDGEYVQIIWDEIFKSSIYQKYINSKELSFADDQLFVINIFKNIMAPNEKLSDYFEDHNIGWVDDMPYVNTWIYKQLKSLKEGGVFHLDKLFKDEDDYKFGKELFEKVMLNHADFEKEIIDKTPNWEMDRIADIDLVLIKMAICEFLKFPSIPAKVTINEYVEISKDYSTDKSSIFINGVLDKVQKEFFQSKRMVKIGRGLL
jgi:N utilization substance protein B